jgi:transcriptional regulator with XRE-family HTH domain
MNQIVGSNIRLLREHRAWTQEHLAQVAGVTPRTLQRVEAGEGAHVDTLQAIAAALDVDVQALRFDALELIAQQLGVPRDKVTPELIAERRKEVDAKYVKVPMTRVASSADLRAFSDAMSFYFDCIPKEDAVQDVAAALQQYLHDLMDIGRDIDATHRRQFEVEAFGHVKELEKLGAAVTVGRRNGRMKIGEHDSMPWNCVYVVVSYKDDVKETVLVPKDGRVSFA